MCSSDLDLVRSCDLVFHEAALRITHCAAEPREAMETMADASFDLIELSASAGVGKFIFASSASIYGDAELFPTSERHHPYGDRTLYGATKLFAESLLRFFHDRNGLDYVVLRYFNVYGPRMDIHGKYTEVLIRWMERIDAGLPPVIFGDGAQTMDFVDVRDVARANLLAARCDATDEAFNIGSGIETSLAALASSLAALMGRPHLQPEFREERTVAAVRRRLADIGKARKLLNFSPQITLENGLKDLIAWWRRTRELVLESQP